MNVWLLCSAIVLAALIPCGVVAMRGDAPNRLVALEMGAIVLAIHLVLLTQGFHRVPFYDVPLALAFLAFGGALVFTRFLERWL